MRSKREVESKHQREVVEYMKDRVEKKINLYGCLARSQRNRYWLVAVLIAVFSAVVPVLINLSDQYSLFKYTATSLSVLVTILVALQEIFKFRVHWRNYNLIENHLRKEEMLFSTQADEYSDEEDEIKRFQLFVSRVEALIDTERTDTILMRTTTRRKDAKKNDATTN